jgi:hypothetical protein
VPCFDASVRVAGCADHLDALLALHPHDEMVMEEPPEHLSALSLETVFERSVLECHGLLCAQERTQGESNRVEDRAPSKVDGAQIGRPLRPAQRLSCRESPGDKSLQRSRTRLI